MPYAAPASADGMSNGVVSGGFSLPCAISMHGTGYRTGQDGLTSGFFNIIIVADPSKLLDHEIGTLGDYIAMMALSQPSSLDSCQDLPSISNLLAKGCASVPASITDGDLAFLKGLYTAKGYEMTIQRDAIRYQMRKALVTDKGGANYRAIPTTRCATLRASMPECAVSSSDGMAVRGELLPVGETVITGR